MSNLGIFLIGLVVTGMVGGALALLLYGAILDGRADGQGGARDEEDVRSAVPSAVTTIAAPKGG